MMKRTMLCVLVAAAMGGGCGSKENVLGINQHASEEAFQIAVRDGTGKDAAECGKITKCSSFAKCVSRIVTIPILKASGRYKALLKLVKKPTLLERMMATRSLSKAVAIARPVMTDEFNKLSKGAKFLAWWAAKNELKEDTLSFAVILKSLKKTTHRAVMKDSDAERGRVLCSDGKVIEIRAHKTPYGKLLE